MKYCFLCLIISLIIEEKKLYRLQKMKEIVGVADKLKKNS